MLLHLYFEQYIYEPNLPVQRFPQRVYNITISIMELYLHSNVSVYREKYEKCITRAIYMGLVTVELVARYCLFDVMKY